MTDETVHRQDIAMERPTKETLVSQVRRLIRKNLMAGRWLPGTRLTIRDLANELDVSTTPVREVVLQLASEGVLQQKHNQSFHVFNLDRDSYLELRNLRVLLEGHAAERAAHLATEAEIGKLSSIHAMLCASEAEQDVKVALEQNQAFHLYLVQIGGSQTNMAFVENLWLKMGPFLNNLYPRQIQWNVVGHSHDSVIAALQAKDADAARLAIQNDIVMGGVEMLASFEKA
ncbi:GntR family transcriptional regulator [Roseovarius aestuarii]|nr:GntR family transcriptional regulator [Roseovarius aestuarii]